MPSEEPLWSRTAAPAPPTAPLEGAARCDLAVVGGGILGLSLALHAAERGVAVTLIEAEEIGGGASGVNAGRVMPDFVRNSLHGLRKALGPARAEALGHEYARAADLVFDLIERHGIDCAATRSGWLLGAHARSKVKDLRRKQREWRSLGRELEFLDADRARALSGCRFHAGLLDPSAGHLNPLSYVRGLARAAIAAGAAVHTGSPAQSLERSGGRWRLRTPAGQLEAEQVFLCVNGRTGGLAPEVERSVLTLSVYEMATVPLDRPTMDRLLPRRHMVSDTRNTVFAYHLDEVGRLLTGAISVPGLLARRRVEREGRRHMTERLGLPDDLPIPHLWDGCASRAPDSRPHLYEVGPGAWAPMACNGRGIASCTAVGRLCARMAAGEDAWPLQPEPPRPIPLHRPVTHLHRLLVSASAIQDHLRR